MECIRIYALEGMRHAGEPVREWLFGLARKAGVEGGTAFRACAGFGRHGVHEDHFFELAGELPECIEFYARPERVDALLAAVSAARVRLFHVRHAVRVGVTGDPHGVRQSESD